MMGDMNLNERAMMEQMMEECYDAEVALRNGCPSMEFLVAHLHEEVSEVFKAWREGEIKLTYSKDRFGLSHPEGLGSEIADVLGCAFILAWAVQLQEGIDVIGTFDVKHRYIVSKAMAKAVESRRASRGDHR